MFLDRDGVIIENRPDHVKSWSEVRFLPGALEALGRLAESPAAIVDHIEPGRGRARVDDPGSGLGFAASHRGGDPQARRAHRWQLHMPASSGRRVRLPQARSGHDRSSRTGVALGSVRLLVGGRRRERFAGGAGMRHEGDFSSNRPRGRSTAAIARRVGEFLARAGAICLPP